MVHATFDQWFLRQPQTERDKIQGDKWLLAAAGYEAAKKEVYTLLLSELADELCGVNNHGAETAEAFAKNLIARFRIIAKEMELIDGNR